MTGAPNGIKNAAAKTEGFWIHPAEQAHDLP